MNYHKSYTIKNWKKYGVISEDYNLLYKTHMEITHCQLCNIKFTDESKYQRSLDHCHATGLYRKTLCRGCNASYLKASQKLKSTNNSLHMFISNQKTKNKSGKYSFTWRYQRKIDSDMIRKCFKTKTKAIAYSFLMLLKKQLD